MQARRSAVRFAGPVTARQRLSITTRPGSVRGSLQGRAGPIKRIRHHFEESAGACGHRTITTWREHCAVQPTGVT